jgi:hypothetical protein
MHIFKICHGTYGAGEAIIKNKAKKEENKNEI